MTAIVMSRAPVLHNFALPVHNVVGVYSNHSEMYAARLRSIDGVKTEWCCWVDDDDELPNDVRSVIDECIERANAVGASLAYTAEIVNDPEYLHVRLARSYDRARHLRDSMYVHHLALMRTEVARRVIDKLPHTGEYWAEHAVFYGLGANGAVAVNRIGYVWNVHSGGVHHWRDMTHAQLNTRRMLEGQ